MGPFLLTLISFLAGTLFGVLICILMAIFYRGKERQIERFINQTAARLKEKGKLLDPANEEVEEFISNLPTEHEHKTD